MNNFEILKQAFISIKENSVRTLMSIVGIAVGIAAVMTIGVITQSGKQFVYAELETYGLNSMWIYRKWEDDSPLKKARQGTGISNEDYYSLNKGCCPDVVRVSPVVYPGSWKKTIRAGSKYRKGGVDGVGVEYIRINGEVLAEGRNFRSGEMKRRLNVAIIGHKIKTKLFGDGRAIGKKIRFDDAQLTVIGILKKKNREFLSAIGAAQGYDENNRILIPFTFYQQVIGNRAIQTLRVEAKDKLSVDKAEAQVKTNLLRRHSYQFKYKSDTMQGWIDTTNEMLYLVTLIGGVGALVALIVGGLGVFNIMSSAVYERTFEIGIRKAIGASPKDILLQFLMEAIYISVIGGIFGIILGVIVLAGLIWWSGFMLSPAWFVVAIAVLFSVLVGVSAGYFPAKRAAKMIPADALRFD